MEAPHPGKLNNCQLVCAQEYGGITFQHRPAGSRGGDSPPPPLPTDAEELERFQGRQEMQRGSPPLPSLSRDGSGGSGGGWGGGRSGGLDRGSSQRQLTQGLTDPAELELHALTAAGTPPS